MTLLTIELSPTAAEPGPSGASDLPLEKRGEVDTRTEMADLLDHLKRYRGVTLQILDSVEESDLSWRPTPDQYTLGQQLLHIAQTEDFYIQGVFEHELSLDRMRLPARLPDKGALRAYFVDVRAATSRHLAAISDDDLRRVVPHPETPLANSLRSWLWFLVEHENHHKGQLAVYLRLMGVVPPFFADVLPVGERPDVAGREELGGF